MSTELPRYTRNPTPPPSYVRHVPMLAYLPNLTAAPNQSQISIVAYSFSDSFEGSSCEDCGTTCLACCVGCGIFTQDITCPCVFPALSNLLAKLRFW